MLFFTDKLSMEFTYLLISTVKLRLPDWQQNDKNTPRELIVIQDPANLGPYMLIANGIATSIGNVDDILAKKEHIDAPVIFRSRYM
jgi:hypothetical protein